MAVKSQKQKVFVAMSGGVDSAVAAALLQQENHEVTGVFFRGWEPPAGVLGSAVCDWREERRSGGGAPPPRGHPRGTPPPREEDRPQNF